MIQGIGASEGIRIGKVFKYNQVELVIIKRTISNVEQEIQRFEDSITKSIEELEQLKAKTEQVIDANTAKIFCSHIDILNDPELLAGVKNKIKEENVNCDHALKYVCDTYVAMFEAMDDEYIRERAIDLKDATKRVLMHIHGVESSTLSEINEEVILVAKDLTPSDTARLNKNMIKGFITDSGGPTSHSAIIARTLEIPAIVGTENAFDTLKNNQIIVLDGFSGKISTNPTGKIVSDIQQRIEQYNQNKAIWETYKDKKSVSLDGKQVKICANIGNPDDLAAAIAYGSDGIGLYRTEFLYMGQKNFLNEEEQLEAYKVVLECMGDKPVIIRTLDIGGDKELDYLHMDEASNPLFRNRNLRFCSTMPDLFKTQLRAILRASIYGNLHIMFPMIATVDELRQAKAILKEVEEELVLESKEIGKDYKIGMMVEVPSVAVLADVFAKEVDFFSIGTNDLIQYTFAADRGDDKVAYLYQPCNPSILQLISMIIKAAHHEGKWVGMCGEMAAEMDAIPVLLGLGLDEFSVSAPKVLKARQLISKISYSQAKALAEKTLEMENEAQVKQLVDEFKKNID